MQRARDRGIEGSRDRVAGSLSLCLNCDAVPPRLCDSALTPTLALPQSFASESEPSWPRDSLRTKSGLRETSMGSPTNDCKHGDVTRRPPTMKATIRRGQHAIMLSAARRSS
jgi:hypothetical protein